MKGKVYLVGAGPGDPDLLTIKALRLLKHADAVLYDELVSSQVLDLVSTSAVLQNVGKRCGKKAITQEEINLRMVQLAEVGLQVVRLKGGDPLVFGRAGEEMIALRNSGIEYEVVPGITAALAAASAARISLTYRTTASVLVFLTGHYAEGRNREDWHNLARSGATLVIYMPGPSYSAVANRLKDAGVDPGTPCAIISRATAADQQLRITSLAGLESMNPLPAPSVMVIGDVVQLAGDNEGELLFGAMFGASVDDAATRGITA
ncbi:MAG TPA: uroporphyrinogen-III C-methyltransferase [Terriglobales bacterium]|nr:uroporphyrinogen-III C-methyltransferase [Terriglobales bacterium]